MSVDISPSNSVAGGTSSFKMELSLNVLEHLGINLYSNVPAVLSEVVANAWDADASLVQVTIDHDNDQIIIQDDGSGMTHDEVNRRFLRVGYRRRDEQPGPTPKGRHPMGRKGIGKLSLFSIAEIIEVYTVKDGDKSALRMQLGKIREEIKAGSGNYEPEELPTDEIDFTSGTKIVLSGLKRQKTIRTSEALRRRLARRFSIIGNTFGFRIEVDGDEVKPEDRDYYDKIQYLWTYGDQTEVKALCANVEADKVEDRSGVVVGKQVTITGWLGTVKEVGALKDSHGDNLNRIAVFVRGKMAQEDILADFPERGVYASYLIGELRVDDLDEDDQEDAATSSRQSIVEDDPRYVALREIIGTELKHIQNRWSVLRDEDGAKKALEIPAVQNWIDGLPKGLKPRAKKWLGKINRIRMDEVGEQKQLIKHAVLAFEFFRCNENLEHLEQIADHNLGAALEIFRELDGLEANLYGQIVQQRIAVIRALQEKVDQNAKEKVIQQYIFDHLWLLDPAWERVEASELMEKRIGSLFDDIDAGLTQEELAGRLDIGYRETAGKHIIVELKRPERLVSVFELAMQVEKYRSGVQKILETQDRAHEPIEFVCLLGRKPKECDNPNGSRIVEDTLKAVSSRVVYYDQLLDSAYRSYKDYLDGRKTVDRLAEIIKQIDDFGAA